MDGRLPEKNVSPLELSAMNSVRPPRALRKFAAVLVCALVVLPLLFVVLPWQQNVRAGGRITAFDPLDRVQVIPAPVTGRLVELNVQDGSFVERGEILAEMADQDPQYALRLEQQLDFTSDKVDAARGMVEFYDQQLLYLEEAKEQAVSSAQFALNVATEKFRGAERDLEALEASRDQKLADHERKSNLFEKGVVSELDYQRAEADYLSTSARVESAKATVEQARNEEQEKTADMGRIANDQNARLESTKSSRAEARSRVALAETERTEAATRLERQKTQVVIAPRTGYVLRVHAASTADFLSRGEPLIELVPEAAELAAELWVRGTDAPLVVPGRKVRLQFDGWPAVQFAGWPSVAIGTFGGVVRVVDPLGDPSGRFRVLVLPDPDDEPWPDRRYLRQGVRCDGWLMLDTVRLGYELWRQLNAFPPSIDGEPGAPSVSGSSSSGGSE